MRIRSALVASLALVCLAAHEAEAQSFEVGANAGFALFLSDLADDFFVCDATGSSCTRIDNATLKNAPALGGHAGARFGAFQVEGNVLFIPSEIGFRVSGVSIGQDTNLLIFGAGLLFNVPTENPFFEPYLVGGLGMKRYSAENVESESDVAFSAGAGLRLHFHPTLALRFEGRNYMSQYGDEQTKLQNDLVITAGLSYMAR